MNMIPTCYYNNLLLKLIDSLIEDGNESYSSLSDADRDRVITHCMDSLGDDAYACVIDSQMMIPDLKRYVLTCKKEEAITLAHNLHEAASNYFQDPMDQLFEQRSSLNRYQARIESGLLPRRDVANGEVSWR